MPALHKVIVLLTVIAPELTSTVVVFFLLPEPLVWQLVLIAPLTVKVDMVDVKRVRVDAAFKVVVSVLPTVIEAAVMVPAPVPF